MEENSSLHTQAVVRERFSMKGKAAEKRTQPENPKSLQEETGQTCTSHFTSWTRPKLNNKKDALRNLFDTSLELEKRESIGTQIDQHRNKFLPA